MGVAYVRGLQGDDRRRGIVATAKHFLGYGASMGGRNQAPVHVGPRELRDVYAAPFAAAIAHSGLAAIMNSYSSIDGLPCAGSREVLTDLLRGELGFAGTVVADYFAVMQLFENHHTAVDRADAALQAISAGLDVELPDLHYYQELPALVRSGRLAEATIDTAVERVLAQKFRLGLFERPYVEASKASARFDTAAQRALARRAAAKGVCLLTNDGVLPLRAGELQNVAVIGPHADDARLLQGDYHYPAHLEIVYDLHMAPSNRSAFQPGPHFTPHVTPLEGLRAALGEGVNVVFARGCHSADPADETIDQAAMVAASAEAGGGTGTGRSTGP